MRTNTTSKSDKIAKKHAKSDPEATMLVIPHSRGAVYTLNGLIDSPYYLRERIDVRTIAPGAYIDRTLCKSIIHYESKRDLVPMIDFMGRWRCRDAIVTIQPHSDAPWFDHAFTSPTYVNSIKMQTQKYMQR